MATNDHTDEQPAVANEPTPLAEDNKVELNELFEEQAGTLEEKPVEEKFAAVDNKVVQEAVDKAAKAAEEKPEDKPGRTQEIVDDAGKQPVQREGEDNAAFQKRVLEEYAKEGTQDKTAEVERLRKELEFYRLLNGDPNQQQQPIQQPQQPVQQPQQVVQQAARTALDVIDITDDELLGLISGDRERALPVVKKFVATAAVIALHEFQNQRMTEQRTNMYVEGVRNHFKTTYEDLNEYPEIVRAVGNDVGNSYVQRGIAKMPHELLDEVAEKSRALIAKFKNGGSSSSPTAVRGSRQGNAGGGTRPATVKQEELTEAQKEMMDLLE